MLRVGIALLERALTNGNEAKSADMDPMLCGLLHASSDLHFGRYADRAPYDSFVHFYWLFCLARQGPDALFKSALGNSAPSLQASEQLAVAALVGVLVATSNAAPQLEDILSEFRGAGIEVGTAAAELAAWDAVHPTKHVLKELGQLVPATTDAIERLRELE